MTEAFGTDPAELVAGDRPEHRSVLLRGGRRGRCGGAGDASTRPRGCCPRNGTSRRHFDLWSANRRWLAEAGVRQVEVAEICTACHMDEFFSYRGGKGRTGHFGALMMVHA